MGIVKSDFTEKNALHLLKHYLPSQLPLKDFVHHNTLHAFQNEPFYQALRKAESMFGYKTTLTIQEYRDQYQRGSIDDGILDRVILEKKGALSLKEWRYRLLEKPIPNTGSHQTMGQVRQYWKREFKLDMDMLVHPRLFKLIGAFLDQGIAEARFPFSHDSLLNAVRKLQRMSWLPVFKSERVDMLLFSKSTSITLLLDLIVGDSRYYLHYLFDQQFVHPGWSGMVAALEASPDSLLDKRIICLRDLIILELLFELDTIESELSDQAMPLCKTTQCMESVAPFSPLSYQPQRTDQLDERWEILSLWQDAFEWSYHDQVLAGLCKTRPLKRSRDPQTPTFQAFFCIDDREESLRRHLESAAPDCATLSTPGHFGVLAYYQPDSGKFLTKICPPPAQAETWIKEVNRKSSRQQNLDFHHASHQLLSGFFLTQTVGLWAAVKLFFRIFKPDVCLAHSSAFEHMEHASDLIIDLQPNQEHSGLKFGFSEKEMVSIVRNLLCSTGLQNGFSPIVYLIGHGGSSTNNPYYSAYNCGACCGRAGSVNARAVADMANRPSIRRALAQEGVVIPENTRFIGALHDTTRDEIRFYDMEACSEQHKNLHRTNLQAFNRALNHNAAERARQFDLVDKQATPKQIHAQVKERSTALFEPRPEYNHSNNTLCVVGHRDLTKHLFLDQRAFLNSYDYSTDPTGHFLKSILQAATPVCGGINLEYYFSRVDNDRLGAGSKLPHNVIGLFGNANGIKGDLRTGLPAQMIEVHDPMRLMMVVEHRPDVVKALLDADGKMAEWYRNGWMKLVVICPETNQLFWYTHGHFRLYEPVMAIKNDQSELEAAFKTTSTNLPVYAI